MTLKIPVTVSLLVAFVPAAIGGPLLDDLLNCARLGAHSPGREDGASIDIAVNKPVGQTFRTTDRAKRVFRIALWQAFWHESWQPDEVLVMTLWDSPQKKTAYGRCGIPYSQRMWENAVPMFTLDARVLPSREYYFELTAEVEPLRPATIPTEWKLARFHPGFAGGLGTISGIGLTHGDYREGTAYLGGEPQRFDLWFEVHEVLEVDRDTLYLEAFNRFELERADMAPIKAAVEQRDWDRAARALVEHFESRTDLIAPDRKPAQLDPTFDTREADLAVEAKVLLEDGSTAELGPFWNHYAQWPERGGVGLTRSGLRKVLAGAYSRTANEKYARAWNSMLCHLFRQSPSPVRAGVLPDQGPLGATVPGGLGGGSMWNGLSIGARLGHGFAYYSAFVDSPSFDPDVRAAFIINLAEMAEVFARMKGGGNWDAQMSMGLMEVGLSYPEIKGAQAWVRQGFDSLVQNALDNVWPDGVAHEPTVNYHGMMMRRYAQMLQQARDLGLVPPPEVAQLTERMYEFLLHATLPDGFLCAWGDSWVGSTPDDLVRDATFFQRPDFLFVGTGGRAGTPPQETSKAFPHGGFYFMRSGWDRQAHYMSIHCGPFGSHGHADALSLIAAAHGRLVLIDPGICTYGTPEAKELSSSRAHNMITVDGRDARSAATDAWVATVGFDFLAGRNHGYEGLPDVRQNRRVWFLKPLLPHTGMWLVFDDVTGTGEHELDLRFRFAQIPVHQDPDTKRIWTGGEGGNLSLEVFHEPAAELSLEEGLAMVNGVEGLTTVPVAIWHSRASLPAAYTSVLLPFLNDALPDHRARLLPPEPPVPNARALWLTLEHEAVLVYVSSLTREGEAPVPAVVPGSEPGRLEVTARAAAVRFLREGATYRPVRLHAVNAQHVRLGERTLLDLPNPVPSVDLAIE